MGLAPRRMIAFEGMEAGITGPRWRADEHEVVRWCRMLVESGIPADRRRLGLDVPPDPAMEGVTVIHPGAASPGRRWPSERFAVVARHEAERGRSVVVTGNASERGLAIAVAEAAGLSRAAVLAGETGIMQLARIVAAAARIVCSDTGVAHLATAVGTPIVVIFGPTSPAHWGPPADVPQHRALWAGLTGDPRPRRRIGAARHSGGRRSGRGRHSARPWRRRPRPAGRGAAIAPFTSPMVVALDVKVLEGSGECQRPQRRTTDIVEHQRRPLPVRLRCAVRRALIPAEPRNSSSSNWRWISPGPLRGSTAR